MPSDTQIPPLYPEITSKKIFKPKSEPHYTEAVPPVNPGLFNKKCLYAHGIYDIRGWQTTDNQFRNQTV